MRSLLAITHLADRELGLAAHSLAASGVEVRRTHLDGDRPGLDDVAGLLVLGGAMGVPDADAYPYLRWELELLEQALAEEVPVLGLCLGAQLLARAAGGRVLRMEERFVGWPRLARLPAAEGDPLFAGLPPALDVLEWHLDAIEPPPGATVLAETGGPGCSVFRVGDAAWGSQIHLELTPAMLSGWLDDPDLVRDLDESGVDAEALVAAAPTRLGGQMRAAEDVLARFAGVVLGRR